MKAILDNFLAILPPFVAIIKHIHITSCLETKPWLPQLPPNFHFALL
ncbi:hypothetical protein G2W53_028733 [Senna tora]|uniref:Uncharacterized protein n=1 Tax=Senna tora TaxID=362788 RepID=A0A834T2V1_9FABA|nr:hypothetical protein G2W53_028733 [Senna tora]